MTAPQLRPFRPQRSRAISLVLALAVPVVLIAGSYFVPNVRLADRLAFVGFSLAVSFVLWRFATVAATPSPDGLVVRNLFITTRLDWAQIISLRFGERPWPQLDLSDGDTLAVMAIQRSDGPVATREAQRLATLIADHEPGVDR